MKTTDRSYKISGMCALSLLAIAASLLTGCEDVSGNRRTITSRDILRAQWRHDSSLRAEANAPGPPRADELRILVAVAAQAERERHELAEYASFQFQQRLALAEASAPRIVVESGNSARSGATYSERNGYSYDLAAPRRRSSRDTERQYVRRALQDSADRLNGDAEARQNEADSQDATPYAEPVQGRPGMAISPLAPGSGYIDIRGYAPGTRVVDPYSGQLMRVP